MTDVKQIAINNEMYGQWWCTNFGDKSKDVIKSIKNKEFHNRKQVRVKVYNLITLKMEEFFLSDLLVAKLKVSEDPFPEQAADEKNQVCVWGPFFISEKIYSFIRAELIL